MKCIKPGAICIGVSRKLQAPELESGLEKSADADPRRSWVFKGEGVKAGDVIGVAFGQVQEPNALRSLIKCR